MSKTLSDFWKILVCIIACLCAGFIGSIFTTTAIPTWYAALEKPAFTPPNWVFAPVWTTLYILMALSAFLVWRKGLNEKGVKPALIIFLVQLILNTSWSIVFFGLKSPIAGVVVILLLWIAILITIIRFFKLSYVAGSLLIPYILWVSIAANLNIWLWLLNRGS